MEKLMNPINQILIVFVGYVVVALCLIPIKTAFPPILAEEYAYVAHATFVLIYIFTNALAILGVENKKDYLKKSFTSFFIFVILGIYIGKYLTGLSLGETSSFIVIYPLLFICYIIISLIVIMISKFLKYAEN